MLANSSKEICLPVPPTGMKISAAFVGGDLTNPAAKEVEARAIESIAINRFHKLSLA